ncbi:MAG: flavodoxin [Clostridiales bacterium]|nr:flavodoxin [Clostridiales bacterium]
MKIAIRYYSKGGNTQKLANALSSELGVPALTVDQGLKEDVDILFLGSAVYAFDADPQVKEFVKNLDVKVGKIVNFSTTAMVKSTYEQVKKLADQKNIPMSEQEFYCKGAFGIFHKGKPNDEDLKRVKAFARSVVK